MWRLIKRASALLTAIVICSTSFSVFAENYDSSFENLYDREVVLDSQTDENFGDSSYFDDEQLDDSDLDGSSLNDEREEVSEKISETSGDITKKSKADEFENADSDYKIDVQVDGESEKPALDFFEIKQDDEPSEYGLINYDFVDSDGNILSSEQALKVNNSSNYGSGLVGASLPSSFDMRKNGFNAPARDQGNDGACWAFSTIAAAESWANLKNYENDDVDFSEMQLAWFGWNTKVKSADDGKNYSDPYSFGGNWLISTASLSNWSGLTDEEVVPYPLKNTSGKKVSEYLRYDGRYRLKNANSYYNASRNDIKNAVKTYGGVQVSYYANMKYHSADEKSYYYNGKADANHSVFIVGWDDNYSKTKFGTDKPKSNGAWLIRGSWGDFADNGYYWISYEDTSLCEFVSYDFVKAKDYDNNYTYNTDGIGGAVSNNETYQANVFTANGDETLKVVSFYTLQALGAEGYSSPKINYEINVYKNTGYDSSTGKLTLGTSLSKTTGSVSTDGYHTVNLAKTVDLAKGDKFTVVVKLTGADGKKVLGIVEGKSADMRSGYGEGYVSIDNKTWYDAKSAGINNNCINALTVDKTIDKTELNNAVNQNSSNKKLSKQILDGKAVLNKSSVSKSEISNAAGRILAARENRNGDVIITTADEWNSFAANVNSGNSYKGKVIKLAADLDFSGKSFTPAGTSAKMFYGIFDAQGYEMCNAKATTQYSGVFGVIGDTAVVRNLVVTNSTFGGESAGGICGYVSNGIIENCGFNGTITSTSDSGGIVGFSENAQITSCYANVSGAKNAIAGKLGDSAYSKRITNCYFSGNSTSSYGKKSTNYLSFAKLINTFSNTQADSKKWGVANDKIVQNSPAGISHKITFTGVHNGKTYSSAKNTDIYGQTSFPDLVAGYTEVYSYEGKTITSSYQFTKDSTVEVTFVELINMSSGTVSQISSKVYTGGEIKPAVTVTYQGNKLIQNTDYTVTYQNNKNIGKATVLINGIGNYTGKITKTFDILPQTPKVKTNFTSTTNAVRINWNKVENCTGYRIYRYNSTSKKLESVTTIKNNSTLTFRDSGRKSATQYRYKVKAYKKVNGVNYWGSASSEIQTATKPVKVKMGGATRTSTAIRINWTKISACDGYEVYRYNTSTKKYTKIATINSSSTTTYRQSGLKKNTTYKYKVRAFKKNAKGVKAYGDFSAIKKVITKK